MKLLTGYLKVSLALVLLVSCAEKKVRTKDQTSNQNGQAIWVDHPYRQEFSIKYYLENPPAENTLRGISLNRDGQVRILAGTSVLVPENGNLFFPGKLIADVSFPQLQKKKIAALGTYLDQTVYLDDRQLFSNAWAGKFQVDHGLPQATCFAGGEEFHFLISDEERICYFDPGGRMLQSEDFKGVRQIKYLEAKKCFLLVTASQVAEFYPGQPVKTIWKSTGITSASAFREDKIIIGTKDGYLILPGNETVKKLPCTSITSLTEIDGQLWFGSECGAFRLNGDGKFSYYAGERWLPGNRVITMAPGPDHSVFVLTDKGLGQISSKMMTLEEKAQFYDRQVREKNIRYGFNCSSVRLADSYASGQTGAQPSDNLWTGMYLASQLFRFKVTGSEDARKNALESFEAMERLFTVTGIPGLFARSYERDFKVDTARGAGWQEKELLTGSPASMWLPAKDHPNWTWRSTASSDQTVGQIFALTTILELADDPQWKARALKCLDDLMGYIVKNDFYLIDVDGKPTLWGKWNPDYVNKFPENVSDRKLYSSNIIAFLQTAWHYTGKALYKDKAMVLLNNHGYLKNLTRPFSGIGASDADNLSKILSSEWNHSDDEMYFLAYPGLSVYAFTPELRSAYQEAIRDHWEIERPEGNALWNFIYASTGAKEFDMERSVGFLQNYPLDLRNWAVSNSHRKDIELLPSNFRGQTTKELLPLGEIPLYRHNGDIFKLDSQGDGSALISAGDVWLLPYWMGRYIGLILPEK